jgi:hypothetical protein
MKFVWRDSGNDEAFLETIPIATSLTNLETLHVVYDKFQPSFLGEGGLKDAAAPWLERVVEIVEANKNTLKTVHLDIPFVPQITSHTVTFTFFASKASAAHLTRLLNTLLFNIHSYGGHDRKAFVCGIPLNHFQITSIMSVP